MPPKTYVLGPIEAGAISEPFTMKWAQASEHIPEDGGTTNVFQDTAMEASSLPDFMALGEKFSSTPPLGGGPGELADTTFG